MSDTSLTGKDLWVEITRLRAQLAARLSEAQQLEERVVALQDQLDEAQREVERLKEQVKSQRQVYLNEFELAVKTRCARLEEIEGLARVLAEMTKHCPHDRIAFACHECWEALRAALAEGQP